MCCWGILHPEPFSCSHVLQDSAVPTAFRASDFVWHLAWLVWCKDSAILIPGYMQTLLIKETAVRHAAAVGFEVISSDVRCWTAAIFRALFSASLAFANSAFLSPRDPRNI